MSNEKNILAALARIEKACQNASEAYRANDLTPAEQNNVDESFRYGISIGVEIVQHALVGLLEEEPEKLYLGQLEALVEGLGPYPGGAQVAWGKQS